MVAQAARSVAICMVLGRESVMKLTCPGSGRQRNHLAEQTIRYAEDAMPSTEFPTPISFSPGGAS
jgi:hypothetical protein